MDEQVKTQGIVVSPWIVTLLISITLNIGGFAYTWGTVVTRLDALINRVERLEKLDDSRRERDATRSPENYTSPPLVP